MSLYHTDDPTTNWQNDALNFSDFRDVLKNILVKADTPLTVGVFGPWGSGKTSLMRMLRDEIEAADQPFLRTVWFTAWKYDQQDALWRTFILRVIHALYPRELGKGPRENRPLIQNPGEPEKKLITLLERLEDSVYKDVMWEEMGARNIQWWQLISNTGKAGLETAAAIGSGGILTQFKKLFGSDETPLDEIQKAALAISRETKTQHRRQLFHIEQFEDTFREAVNLIDPHQGGRIIIFVDDLDRCLPEKTIEILEAMKLFLGVTGAVFILGMDRAVVQQGIEARYRLALQQDNPVNNQVLVNGDAYLHKLIQIPFHLPILSIGNLDKFVQQLAPKLSDMTRQVFIQGVFPNPRQIKRVLNIFHLLQQIVKKRESRGILPKESVSWPLLAKSVIIQSQYPRLYHKWGQQPELIQQLEQQSVNNRTEMAHLLPYLDNPEDSYLLNQMLTYPPQYAPGEKRDLARFSTLGQSQLAFYVRLAGIAESQTTLTVNLPSQLFSPLLSGEQAIIQDTVHKLRGQEVGIDGPLLSTARRQLLDVLQSPAWPANNRASAGYALALLDDPRFRPDAWFLPGPPEPLLGFVEIPEGPFLMGSNPEKDSQAQDQELNQHELFLPTFYIARFPITIGQFRAYDSDVNYIENLEKKIQRVERSREKERQDQSKEQRATNRKPFAAVDRLRSAIGGILNHPIVNISWQEAIAYCDWFTQKLIAWTETPEPLATLLREKGWRVTLPSEAEWEKACRGQDGRLYTWGNDFDPKWVNCQKADLKGVSSVGCFPLDVSPYGLFDMCGNVGEWTRSLWNRGGNSAKPNELEFIYPYEVGGERESLEAGTNAFRVFRGGAFISPDSGCRAANRSGLKSNRYSPSLGMRVALCRPLSSK